MKGKVLAGERDRHASEGRGRAVRSPRWRCLRSCRAQGWGRRLRSWTLSVDWEYSLAYSAGVALRGEPQGLGEHATAKPGLGRHESWGAWPAAQLPIGDPCLKSASRSALAWSLLRKPDSFLAKKRPLRDILSTHHVGLREARRKSAAPETRL